MLEQSRLNYGLLQQAVNFGIADIDDGNFRDFDTPKALVRHLQSLAEDIFAHENCTFGWRCSGHQNHSKLL